MDKLDSAAVTANKNDEIIEDEEEEYDEEEYDEEEEDEGEDTETKSVSDIKKS